jgi:stage II sporulation protein Q
MVTEVIEMNNDKNQEIKKEQAPKTVEGAAVQKSAWKKLMAKKWVFPAAYMAAAAIILTLMWVYQGANQASLKDGDLGLTKTEQSADSQNNEAVEVNAQAESLGYPVANPDELLVSKPFYDPNASNEVKQAAVVEHQGTFTLHMGVDYASKDNTTFDVLAALSGTVTRVEKHLLLGNLVEITAPNGTTKTIYQSLDEVAVTNGQEVKKGDVIAKAGRNELEKDQGIHVHFEVQENDKPVDPNQLFVEEEAENQ